MNFRFEQATKEQIRLRMALVGPTGCGKTYTALKLATLMSDKVAVIDTENSSASRYADEFAFQRLNLNLHSPDLYIEAIQAAGQAGFEVLIIDSLSHAWMGRDGTLALVDKAAKRYKGNSFAAWRDVTPLHNALVDSLIHCSCHLFVTMRAKTEWIIEKDKDGRSTPKKVGLAPIMRDGIEYEFDVVGDMDETHNLVVSKTRCPILDGEVIRKPGKELAETLLTWLGSEPAETRLQSPNSQGNTNTSAEAVETDGSSLGTLSDDVIDRLLDDVEELNPTPSNEASANADENALTPDGGITSEQMVQLDQLGLDYYGKERWQARKQELVAFVTDSEHTRCEDITNKQAQELIDGLQEKLNEAIEESAKSAETRHAASIH